MSTRRFHVGLAATLHDPALAIVDEAGRVVFAEAAERPLQDKRAFNCPPDHLVHAERAIRLHCGDDPHLTVAVSWSAAFRQRLRLGAACDAGPLRVLLAPLRDALFRRRDHLTRPLAGFRSLASGMSTALEQAGRNLEWRGLDGGRPARRYDHHLTHAATACFGSPFDEALCAVVDGFGEWTSAAFFRYAGGRLEPLRRAGAWGSWRRASLGMFYGALCDACGFDMLAGEEWKVMGLAPHGRPDAELLELLRPLLRVEGLELVLGCPPREYRARLAELKRRGRPAGSPPEAAADLARSGQQVFGEVLSALLRNLHAEGGSDDLVLAGGCALNSSHAGRLLAETPFEALHVPSAPADDGNAIGAALLSCYEDHPEARPEGRRLSPYLGSRPSQPALERLVASWDPARVEHLPGRVAARTARLLADGRVVGWMRGRAEFGPRALGHRSILADPRDAGMKDRINALVKFREGFRPFAPSVLHERGPDWFEDYTESPYMERTLRFREELRGRVPAVVHVDGTGRVQSVRPDWCATYHELLVRFEELTGVPMLLNTSFNVMGRPIVHSVEDAVAAFLTTGLDALVIEDHLFLAPGRS